MNSSVWLRRTWLLFAAVAIHGFVSPSPRLGVLTRQPLKMVASAEKASFAKPNALSVLWKFSRPHTLIGTLVCVPSLHALAAPSLASACTATFWSSVAWALVPAALVNVFVTGLNQVCDVEIDKVNKPHLPIPRGYMTRRQGALVCAACLVSAVAIAAVSPFTTGPLWAVLLGSAALGAAYSVPPIRLKRWPLLAALSIVAIRGALINACFFAHAAAVAFDPSAYAAQSAQAAHLPLVIGYYGLFGVAIALMKDVPDVEGDRRFNVPTLSSRIGRKTVFSVSAKLVVGLLLAASTTLIVAAATTSSLVFPRLAAGLAAAGLAKAANDAIPSVDAERKENVSSYYMRIWKIFYLSYAILPFAR